MNNDSVVPRVSWKEVYGNPFSKGLNNAMLSDAGFIYATHARLLSNPNIKTFCQIHYDRNYVLAYLERKIIKSLAPLNKSLFLKLMESAWKYHERVNPLEYLFEIDDLGNWTVSNCDSMDEVKDN